MGHEDGKHHVIERAKYENMHEKLGRQRVDRVDGEVRVGTVVEGEDHGRAGG